MKNLILKLQLCFVILICMTFALYAQSDNVGIGTTTPDASSILELQTTDKGFLPPRMTTAQRNAITSPAAGLIIFNTTTSQINTYNGSTWLAIPNTNNTASKIIKETISKDVANVAAASSVTEVFTLSSTLNTASTVAIS